MVDNQDISRKIANLLDNVSVSKTAQEAKEMLAGGLGTIIADAIKTAEIVDIATEQILPEKLQ